MGSKLYSDVTSEINDIVSDTTFTANRSNEILRAVKAATDRVNVGDTGEDNGMDAEVGYDFQIEVANVTFDSDNDDYILASTLSLKFPTDLRVQSDENLEFHYVEPHDYFRRNGVLSSTELMYTITFEGGTRILKINYSTSDTLELEYMSNYMWLDDDASTRKENTDGDNSDTLLMDDRFWRVIPLFASASLIRQRTTPDSVQAKNIEDEAVRLLKRMKSSIGIIRRFPTLRPKIRSEWPRNLGRIDNN